MKHTKVCPECGGTEIYRTEVRAKGEIDLLPRLGEAFNRPKFDIFVCAKCGYCCWFVGKKWLREVPEKWDRHE